MQREEKGCELWSRNGDWNDVRIVLDSFGFGNGRERERERESCEYGNESGVNIGKWLRRERVRKRK